MARLNFWAPSGEVSLTTGTKKTVLTVKSATNIRTVLKGLEIFFKGTSATDTPVKIDFGRISSDGTGTAWTAALNDDDMPETVQASGKANYTVEPTYSNTIKTQEIHPQTGLVVYYPLGEELIVGGGKILGIAMTSGQSETVSTNAYCEE